MTTALLLVSVALAISNHADGTPPSGPATQFVTGLEQPLAQSGTFAATETTPKTRETPNTGKKGHSYYEAYYEDRSPAANGRRPDGRPAPLHFKEYPENVQRITAALEEETSLEFVDAPLSEAAQYISDVHDITILIDEAALQGVGLATDVSVNLIISGITLESAFNLILRPLGLAYVIRDEVLMITTRNDAEKLVETRVYELRQFSRMSPQEIASLIQKSIEGPWQQTRSGPFPQGSSEGGVATPFNGGMVVRHNQRVHREIVELLKQLERHAALGAAGRRADE